MALVNAHEAHLLIDQEFAEETRLEERAKLSEVAFSPASNVAHARQK
jgi:hypothetical protein